MGTTVLFKVRGGHSVGLGHVRRSLCLAKTLEDDGLSIGAFFCNPDDVSTTLIQRDGYEVVHWILGDPRSDASLLGRVLTMQADILVLDQPESDREFLHGLRGSGSRVAVVALDYFDMEEDRLDLIINLFNHHPSLKAPRSERVTYVEGPEYAIIRPAFDPFVAMEKPIREMARDVLVSFGGSDVSGNTLRVLDAVECIGNTDLRFHVVIGPSFADSDAIRQRLNALEAETLAYDSVPNMAELMFNCDMGLTGGGTTMMEMAVVGTPSMVLPQNERERSYACFFEKHGGTCVPGRMEEVSPEALADEIVSIAADCRKRALMNRAAKTLVDGKGRFRISRLICVTQR